MRNHDRKGYALRALVLELTLIEKLKDKGQFPFRVNNIIKSHNVGVLKLLKKGNLPNGG